VTGFNLVGFLGLADSLGYDRTALAWLWPFLEDGLYRAQQDEAPQE
jgi:hypothetical protein